MLTWLMEKIWPEKCGHEWHRVDRHLSIGRWLENATGKLIFIGLTSDYGIMQYCTKCKEFEWKTEIWGRDVYIGTTYKTMTKKLAEYKSNEIGKMNR